MQIQLAAVGNRMPDWVAEGYREYAKRLPRECELILREIAPGKRGKHADLDRVRADEGERLLATVARDDHVIALEIGGQPWSTLELAGQLEIWLQQGRRVTLLVGGPEGLSEACQAKAKQRWSLSPLTLPHPIVRVILAEQLYRAWSVLNHHPYHR